MAKNSITDFSTTASSNEDIGGTAILGTSPRSNFDNAFRELMAQLAEAYAGTAPAFDTFTFADPADLTKRFRFDAGGVTAGQTRALTVPDYNGTLATQAGTETLTNKSLVSPVIAGAIFGTTTPDFTESVTITATNDGATGPLLVTVHTSASPAPGDVIAEWASLAKDSAANFDIYAAIRSILTSATSGAESSVWAFMTRVAGTLAERFRVGAGLYMEGATGGDPGVGKINATEVQANGTPLITAAGVPTAIVALSAGDIGTTLMLRQSVGATRALGYQTTHTNLLLSDTGGGSGSAPPAGTYELQGQIVNANEASLWLRIS